MTAMKAYSILAVTVLAPLALAAIIGSPLSRLPKEDRKPRTKKGKRHA